MRTFLFYTPEGCTISPNETEVENFQVLGTAEGVNVQEALKVLINENEWIEKYGFSVEKIKHYPLLTN